MTDRPNPVLLYELLLALAVLLAVWLLSGGAAWRADHFGVGHPTVDEAEGR